MQLPQCSWCDKEFIPTEKKIYSLEGAGTKVCMACSDLWEAKEIELHNLDIKAYLDDDHTHVHTWSGSYLPLKLGNWRFSNWTIHPIADVIDSFGNKWRATLVSNPVVKLHPIH